MTSPSDEVSVPCQVDGSPIAATLRGFGHGWQGQHNTTNAVVVFVYDGYNQRVHDDGITPSMRTRFDSSDFVAYEEPVLFEPMSLREENWAERNIKNALRAEASKSSHAVVSTVYTVHGEHSTAMTGNGEAAVAFPTEVARCLDTTGGYATSQGGSIVLGDTRQAWPLAERGRDDGAHLELGEEGTYNTLAAGNGGSSRRQLALIAESQENSMENETNLVVRRLTPLECELLMGWEKNWTAEGMNEDGTIVKMADTHRYRMCGNGVVANVGEWIALRYIAARAESEAETETE